MIVWPTKGPAEAYDYAFDFSGALAPGEAISAETVAAAGVTVDADDIVGSEVVVSLSAGTAGTVAKVTCTITTSASPPRTFSEVAVLEIGGDAVSLASAKADQKIDNDDEDALLAGFLRAAVRNIESQSGKNLTPRIENQVADGFPPSPCAAANRGAQAIRLWKGPVSEILSIKYDDADGIEQMLSGFRLVDGGGKIRDAKLLPAFGESWPVTAAGQATVRISYVAGYDPADLDLAELTQAALLLFGHFNANREAAVMAGGSAQVVELPLGVRMLIEPHRMPGIA